MIFFLGVLHCWDVSIIAHFAVTIENLDKKEGQTYSALCTNIILLGPSNAFGVTINFNYRGHIKSVLIMNTGGRGVYKVSIVSVLFYCNHVLDQPLQLF